MGIRGRQEAPTDGNGEGSEHDGNKGDEESKGVEGNEGEGNEGDNGNLPREEGDDGHNNQLGTKLAAMARTVVAKTARG